MESSAKQMQTIDYIVRDSVGKVNELHTQVQEISQLVIVIKEIAEQTNLLSLNAQLKRQEQENMEKDLLLLQKKFENWLNK